RAAGGLQSVGIDLRGRGDAPLFSNVVANVDSHFDQPWLERATAIKPMKKTERPQKDFLSRILRVFRGSKKPPGDGQHASFVSQNDSFECRNVSGDRAFQKLPQLCL